MVLFLPAAVSVLETEAQLRCIYKHHRAHRLSSDISGVMNSSLTMESLNLPEVKGCVATYRITYYAISVHQCDVSASQTQVYLL